jgi:hypothetical protein
MLQPALSLLPLASCFDYAYDPQRYRPEQSWARAVSQQFGADALPCWRALRRLFDLSRVAKKRKQPLIISPRLKAQIAHAWTYIERNRRQRWARELAAFGTIIKGTL